MELPKKLRVSKRFCPCPIDPGDEIYPNGIFEFNITKMTAFILNNPDQFHPEEVEVATLPDFSNSLDPTTVEKADITAPIILAEVAPGRFNVIDGNHRLKKARVSGAKKILAFKVSHQVHTQFLTSNDAYVSYVSYWNEKVGQAQKYRKQLDAMQHQNGTSSSQE